MRSLTVLVVDDCHDHADMIALMLKNDGHRVTTAYSGNDAIECCCKQAQALDAVLLDIMMPSPNGIETCRRIKELSESIIVVAVTGYTDPGMHAQAVAAGFLRVLLKPVELPHIYEVLAEATKTCK